MSLYFFICLQIKLKFLFEDSKTILKKNFFLSIILKAETPIYPVAPSKEIFFFIYLKNINKNMKPAGKPNIIPSILSRMPP